MQLGELVVNVRSKNAGPYWVTIDVFCGTDAVYAQMHALLTKSFVASLYQQPEETLKYFELPDLQVLKFSFPRTVVQGSRYDRDMHGAQYSVLLSELEITTAPSH